jgi:replication factor C large subunit
MKPLSEKYRPENFNQIIGQDKAIQEIKEFIRYFPKKQAAILHGPAGTGKTALAYAVAQETNSEIFELNASDIRDRKKLEAVMKPVTQQKTLFNKKGKIILVDEVDGISGKEDRGGIPELIELIKNSPYPIILTANNIWRKKFSSLRRKCLLIKLKELKYDYIFSILKKVAENENKEISEDTLKTIASKAKGDARAALNDLQSVLNLKIKPEDIHEREKDEDIFNALKRVLQDKNDPRMLWIYDSVDMSLDDIFLWLEENIAREYVRPEEIAKAYDALSKADVFRGRIYRQQHWRFLVYENFLLSAGVSFAKKNAKTGFTKYQRPKRILKMWIYKQKFAQKKSISAKYARFAHISTKRAMKEFFYISLIIGDKVKKQLNLSEKEIKFLDEYKKKQKTQLNTLLKK